MIRSGDLPVSMGNSNGLRNTKLGIESEEFTKITISHGSS
jgi:hypothetical protein